MNGARFFSNGGNGARFPRMKGSEIASRIKKFCYCGGAPVPPEGTLFVSTNIATGTPGVVPGQMLEGAKIVVLSQGTGKLVSFGGRNIAVGSVVYDSTTGKTQVIRQGQEEAAPKFSLLRWRE